MVKMTSARIEPDDPHGESRSAWSGYADFPEQQRSCDPMPFRPMTEVDDRELVSNAGRVCPNRCKLVGSQVIDRKLTNYKTLIVGNEAHIIVPCQCPACYEKWCEAYTLSFARSTYAEVSEAIQAAVES